MDSDSPSRSDWLDQGPSDPAEVGGHYDQWASGYDDDLTAWSYQAPDVVAETVVARAPSVDSLLDAGCGTGMAGRALRARGFTGRVVGLDASPDSLRIARESGAYDDVRAADLQQDLDLEDDSVGALICVGVMTYLPDVERVWRELARVVRPGGLVVVTQRDDLWEPRRCQEVVDLLASEGVWSPVEVVGPAAYLPEGYGGTPKVDAYYLSAIVG